MTLRWPPNKAWTSASLIAGYRHFVALNYGGKGYSRWVNLVSVIDGNVSLKISWIELSDTSLWISGWLSLDKNQSIPPNKNDYQFDELTEKFKKSSCLHPSSDSGFTPSNNYKNSRPWF